MPFSSKNIVGLHSLFESKDVALGGNRTSLLTFLSDTTRITRAEHTIQTNDTPHLNKIVSHGFVRVKETGALMVLALYNWMVGKKYTYGSVWHPFSAFSWSV